MLGSLIRSVLLLSLHAFLLILWVGFQRDLLIAVDWFFFSQATGEKLNLAFPVNFLLLWWLIPVLLRRADARFAWSSMLLAVLGMILCFVYPVKAAAAVAFVESPLRASDWVSMSAWGLVSSAGMLVSMYLRDYLARQRARRAGRAAWWAALCAFMNCMAMVFSFLLIIALIQFMGDGAEEGLRSAMWLTLLIFFVVVAWLMQLVTQRQVKRALYLSLLVVMGLVACSLMIGARRELEFRKEGQQWLCSYLDEREHEGDLRLLRASMNESAGVAQSDWGMVELAIVEEWYLNVFVLKLGEGRIEKNRCVSVREIAAQDGEVVSVDVLDIHRPQLRLGAILLLAACGLLLLRRAMRTVPEGLPRRR